MSKNIEKKDEKIVEINEVKNEETQEMETAEQQPETTPEEVPVTVELKENWIDKIQKRNHDHRVKVAEKKLAKQQAKADKTPLDKTDKKMLIGGGLILAAAVAGGVVKAVLTGGSSTSGENQIPDYTLGTGEFSESTMADSTLDTEPQMETIEINAQADEA